MRRLTAIPGVLLIAVAAAMWGTDPIIRKTMSGTTSATTIVFGEHVILVLLTLPLLLPALLAVFRAGWRYVGAAVVIGAGAPRRDRRRSLGRRHDPLHRRADRPLRLHHAGRDPEGAAAHRDRGCGGVAWRAAAAELRVVLPSRSRRLLARQPGASARAVGAGVDRDRRGDRRRCAMGAGDGARALHVPRARVPAHPEPALLLRPDRERDRVADHGRTRLLERARHVSHPLPGTRHRAGRADALLLRAAAHSGRPLVARGAHLSGGGRDRGHLRVQPAPGLDAVARSRPDPRLSDAPALPAAARRRGGAERAGSGSGVRVSSRGGPARHAGGGGISGGAARVGRRQPSGRQTRRPRRRATVRGPVHPRVEPQAVRGRLRGADLAEGV